MIHDGLWDIYNNHHMGICGEVAAEKYNITREDQDKFAILSYKRATDAWNSNKYDDEVIPVEIQGKRGEASTFVTRDEEFTNIKLDKVATLRPAFKKENGTVTAANSSKLNDGAAAMILVSGKLCKELNLTPLFKIRGFGDAAQEPVMFTTAPSLAIPR